MQGTGDRSWMHSALQVGLGGLTIVSASLFSADA
jgi:hypothetical protein